MTRKKVIPKTTECYEYGNPNPKGLHTSDCTIRCISIAAGLPWETAYDILAIAGKETCTVMDSKESIRKVLKDLNFERIPIKNSKGTKKPCMKVLKNELQDKIAIGQVMHHIMCMKDGKVWDTWDSSGKSLQTYWIYRGNDIKKDAAKLLIHYGLKKVQ